jgi:HAD superfamily hydrolase (TIGR01509 family)
MPVLSPRAVIFDVEGTLIDCVALILESWRGTLQAAGHTFTPKELQPYSGMDGAWMLEQLLPHENEEHRHQLVKSQADRYRKDFIHQARTFSGVHAFFRSLKQAGISIGIATTCQPDELALYDRHMRVLHFVDEITCGEMIKRGKPDPSLFSLCLAGLGIKTPASALAIGDTPFDALAARAVGMSSVGVLTGGFPELALLDAGHDLVFPEVWHARSLFDLKDIPTH